MLSDITEIGKYVFTALGGGTAALALFIKFGANRIADVTLAKYQSKLDENLETHKARVEAKKHVTQFRFDKEFEILYQLIQDYYEFTYLTWSVYLSLESGDEEHLREKYETFQNACDEYTKFFYRNSAIISKDIADAFDNGIGQMNKFRNIARKCVDEFLAYGDLAEADLNRLKLIHDEINTGEEYGIKKMTNLVRSHLDSLEIV